MTPRKTQAMRRLDAAAVPYRAIVYDETGAFHSAEKAAALIGAPPDAVLKTLVLVRDPARTRPLLVLAPSNVELDLKALARHIGEKRLRMATRRESEALTGMQAGGISALGLRPGSFDVYIDERALALERMYVSAGARGIELELRPADFVRLTNARPVSLTG
jgi:Cys-tRNA(Pro)/Cys-tRNA(Cys) deacylase